MREEGDRARGRRRGSVLGGASAEGGERRVDIEPQGRAERGLASRGAHPLDEARMAQLRALDHVLRGWSVGEAERDEPAGAVPDHRRVRASANLPVQVPASRCGGGRDRGVGGADAGGWRRDERPCGRSAVGAAAQCRRRVRDLSQEHRVARRSCGTVHAPVAGAAKVRVAWARPERRRRVLARARPPGDVGQAAGVVCAGCGGGSAGIRVRARGAPGLCGLPVVCGVRCADAGAGQLRLPRIRRQVHVHSGNRTWASRFRLSPG